MGALANILFPWLVRYLLDAIITVKDISLLLSFAMAILILNATSSFVNYGRIYTIESLSKKIISTLRERIFQHCQRLSLSYYEARRTGEIMARITSDVKLIENMLDNELKDVPFRFLSLIGASVFMIYIDWSLSIITFFFLPVLFIILRLIKLNIAKFTEAIQDKQAELTSALEENISGIRVVKAYTMEENEIERFKSISQGELSASLREIKFNRIVNFFGGFMGSLCMVFILVAGGMKVIEGKMTMGTLTAFLLYVGMINVNAGKFFQGAIAFKKGIIASERIFKVLDEDPETKNEKNSITLPTVKGIVEFRNVRFEYKKGLPVLKNISFTTEPGSTTAIVGHSGAGKSTVIKLLFRFYDIDNGAIEIDGCDIRKLNLKFLRSHMAIVLQEDILFSTTIGENIAYGDKYASLQKIKDAAILANAHEFIMELPQQYDTKVGSRGYNLSAGQRQRIALARAVHRDPGILVLDEPFSSLDGAQEALIQEALKKFYKGKTVFIIAHRLSTIINAAKIIVINDGEVVGNGRHDELLRNNDFYNKLYKTQIAENVYSRE